MMDRDTILQIVSSMDTGKLVDMLGAVGVQVSNPEQGLEMDEGSQLEDWNSREVAVGPANKPEIFDRNMTVKIPELEPRGEEMEYMDDEYEPSVDEFAAGGQGGY